MIYSDMHRDALGYLLRIFVRAGWDTVRKCDSYVGRTWDSMSCRCDIACTVGYRRKCVGQCRIPRIFFTKDYGVTARGEIAVVPGACSWANSSSIVR